MHKHFLRGEYETVCNQSQTRTLVHRVLNDHFVQCDKITWNTVRLNQTDVFVHKRPQLSQAPTKMCLFHHKQLVPTTKGVDSFGRCNKQKRTAHENLVSINSFVFDQTLSAETKAAHMSEQKTNPYF